MNFAYLKIEMHLHLFNFFKQNCPSPLNNILNFKISLTLYISFNLLDCSFIDDLIYYIYFILINSYSYIFIINFLYFLFYKFTVILKLVLSLYSVNFDILII